MDYEKAYKAVLETATQWIKDGCTDKERICLESVFPELRESEDERNERIRKAIVHLLEVASEAYLIDATGFKKEQFLSYLEKQKESLHIQETCKENADYFTDGIIEVRSFRRGMEEGRRLEKQKEQKPTIAGNDFGWIDELKHDLEHPEELDQKVDDVLKQRKGTRALEWSDTDNIGWDEAFACVTRAEKAAKNEEELQNAVTAEKWLKEIKFKYCVHPDKQEWSEEDEEMIKMILGDLEWGRRNTTVNKDIKLYDEKIAWLKSLRPQPGLSKEDFIKFGNLEYERGFKDGERSYWKPSEEQMRR